MNRYLLPYLCEDLQKKMVWLGGPRQVGKTTLAKQLAEQQYSQFEYLNWDLDSDRQDILNHHWQTRSDLIVFDELHKYPHWKQWIKGVYDTKLDTQQFFVTGSARLDVYRRGGDSLLGRYHYWRLHPFTLDEWPDHLPKDGAVDRLLELGGFPEPFLGGDIRLAKRWRNERAKRILTEDIRALEKVHELQLLDLFVDALRERVGSMLVIANLAQDLKVAHKTCSHWLAIVERMYLAFPIYPLTKNIPRSIQKPAKVYFYDNGDAKSSDGGRFENLVATHLLKRLQFMEDYGGAKVSLHYIRDKDGREVDFVTVVDGKVHELIEVKLSDEKISTALKYYHNRLQPEKTTQILKSLKKPYDKDGIRVTTAEDYFSESLW
jgi:uncharacterized protein